MSQEINLNVTLTARKGGEGLSSQTNLVLNLTGSELIGTVQTISTAAAAVPIGSCDQLQIIKIKNMPFLADGTTANTASITLGLNTPITQVFSVLPPGGVCLLMGCPTTLYAQASAGTPDMFVGAAEN